MYFKYSIQRISQDFSKKFQCFYCIHMGSITSHSYMFTALSIIPQLSGKNRKILKEKQFRLKDWAPLWIFLWIFPDPWNSFSDGSGGSLPAHSTGRKPHTLNRMTLKKLLSFLATFSDLLVLVIELHCVNIKDFLVLFKGEPALNSLTAVCFASGTKDSRNWPQNETSFQLWW